METIYFNDLTPSGCYTTSQLNSIVIESEQEKVNISVVRDPDGQIDTILTLSLYTFDGVAHLDDIGSVIEARFRELDISRDVVEIVAGDVAVSFVVQYCEIPFGDGDSIEGKFLTASHEQVVHRSSFVSICHVNSGTINEYTFRAVGQLKSGAAKAVQGCIPLQETAPIVITRLFSVKWLTNFAMDLDPDLEKICYFTISYGNDTKTFYIVDDPFFITFGFKNIYNLTEYVDIPGSLKRALAVDRDFAVSNSTRIPINRRVARSFELSTTALTRNQAVEIEQLAISHNVQIVAEEYTPVVITESKLERSNDDSNLVSMQISFRLSDDRMLFSLDDLKLINPVSGRIFTEQFTKEFV